MTTAAEIIKAALEELRVVDAGMALDPIDFERCRGVLNRMMVRWEADGLPMGWAPVKNPTDTVSFPEEVEEVVIANLAIRLKSKYGSEVSDTTAETAVDGLAKIRRDIYATRALWLITDQPCETGIQGFDLNIIRGTYY